MRGQAPGSEYRPDSDGSGSSATPSPSVGQSVPGPGTTVAPPRGTDPAGQADTRPPASGSPAEPDTAWSVTPQPWEIPADGPEYDWYDDSDSPSVLPPLPANGAGIGTASATDGARWQPSSGFTAAAAGLPVPIGGADRSRPAPWPAATGEPVEEAPWPVRNNGSAGEDPVTTRSRPPVDPEPQDTPPWHPTSDSPAPAGDGAQSPPLRHVDDHPQDAPGRDEPGDTPWEASTDEPKDAPWNPAAESAGPGDEPKDAPWHPGESETATRPGEPAGGDIAADGIPLTRPVIRTIEPRDIPVWPPRPSSPQPRPTSWAAGRAPTNESGMEASSSQESAHNHQAPPGGVSPTYGDVVPRPGAEAPRVIQGRVEPSDHQEPGAPFPPPPPVGPPVSANGVASADVPVEPPFPHNFPPVSRARPPVPPPMSPGMPTVPPAAPSEHMPPVPPAPPLPEQAASAPPQQDIPPLQDSQAVPPPAPPAPHGFIPPPVPPPMAGNGTPHAVPQPGPGEGAVPPVPLPPQGPATAPEAAFPAGPLNGTAAPNGVPRPGPANAPTAGPQPPTGTAPDPRHIASAPAADAAPDAPPAVPPPSDQVPLPPWPGTPRSEGPPVSLSSGPRGPFTPPQAVPDPPRQPEETPQKRRRTPIIAGAVATVVALGVVGAILVPEFSSPGTAAPRTSETNDPAAPADPGTAGEEALAIDFEESDPAPLTLEEAFPQKKVTLSGTTFTRVKTDMTEKCDEAAFGAFATALVENGCDRVVRATYVDTKKRYAITTGIAVLPTKEDAVAADQAKNLSENIWFRGLPGKKGTGGDRVHIAGGYASGLVWGRYIVFSYATNADGHTPTAKETILGKLSGDFRDTTSLVLERRITG